jgi:hypothetical protein
VLAILRAAPNLNEVLCNFGDLDHEPFERVLLIAANVYQPSSKAGPLRHTLFMLANDFFRGETKAFNEAVGRVLGIDGMSRSDDDGTHYLVFTPEQITVTERLSREKAQARVQAETEREAYARPGVPRPFA